MIPFVRPTHRLLGRLAVSSSFSPCSPSSSYRQRPRPVRRMARQGCPSSPSPPGQGIRSSWKRPASNRSRCITRKFLRGPPGSGVRHNNTVSYRGQTFLNAGETVQAGNTITRLAADDITVAGAFSRKGPRRRFEFSVANLDAATVSFCVCVCFYQGQCGRAGDVYHRLQLQPHRVFPRRFRLLHHLSRPQRLPSLSLPAVSSGPA